MTGFLQQANSAGTSALSNVAISYPGACTVGSALVIMIRVSGLSATAGTLTVSDPTNGNWTSRTPVDETAGGDSFYAATFANNQGNTALAVSMSFTGGVATIRANIREYSTTVTSNIVDAYNCIDQTASTTTPATGSITTTNGNDVLIAAWGGNNGTGTVTDNVAGSNPSSGWGNVANVGTSKLHVADVVVTSTSSTYGETLTLSVTDNGNFAIMALKLSAALSLTATPLAGAAPTLGTPSLGIYSAVILGNNVLDFGLNRLHTNANSIYICSTVPTTYVQATTTFSLGNASIAAGTLFGTMANGSPTGRIVNSAVVSAGAVTAAGTPVCWAVVDSVNSDLMATGPGSGFTAVTSGQTWQLASFDIHMSNT